MDYYRPRKKDNFTLTGLLIILAASSFLFFLIVFVANPRDINLKTHDLQRITDMKSLSTAIDLYLADVGNFNSLEENKIYQSNQGSVANNGSGWLPLNFSAVSSGPPINVLPKDPSINTFYRFSVDKQNKTYELDCLLEDKNNRTLSQNDKGNNPEIYEMGSGLKLIQ